MVHVKVQGQPEVRLGVWPERGALLEFVRGAAPDLRIMKVRLEDGRRACGARFTFRGESFEVEAIESDGSDPDVDIVRHCAWHIYRRLGKTVALDDGKADQLRRDIVAASIRGDSALADKLGLELAMHNDALGVVDVPMGMTMRLGR